MHKTGWEQLDLDEPIEESTNKSGIEKLNEAARDRCKQGDKEACDAVSGFEQLTKDAEKRAAANECVNAAVSVSPERVLLFQEPGFEVWIYRVEKEDYQVAFAMGRTWSSDFRRECFPEEGLP